MDNQSLNFTKNHIHRFLEDRPFRFFQTIGSTNDAARKWLEEDQTLSSGALVLADEQTAGRGRMSRVWKTPPQQALAVSFILRPKIDPAHLQRITMMGGLAVVEAISELLNADVAQLKWPNDVQITGLKVCGILAEAVWFGNVLQAIILGIGINVNVAFSGTELAEIATSIQDHTSEPVNRFDLLQILINRLDYWFERMNDSILVDSWRERLITLGQHVKIHTQHQHIVGIAKDVDNLGALIVVDDEGHQHRVLVGDVVA